MQTVTQMLDDEVYVAKNEAGHSVMIDMRADGEKMHQSPVELLLSSLSACAAVDLVTILKKRKKTIARLTVETKGVRHEQPPRYFTAIHINFVIESPDATLEEAQKAAHLSIEKYCSVASSLKSTVTWSVRIESKP